MQPKFIGITGVKKSGKTTTIESIVPILRKKNFKVGTVKIAYREVSIDVDNAQYDVIRHRKSTPNKTLFKSKIETVYFDNEKQTLREALKEFSEGLDFILLEGFTDDLVGLPQIALLKEAAHEKEIINEFTVAVSSIPEFSVESKHKMFVQYEKLCEIVEAKALPLFPNLNCDHCGFENCNSFIKEVIAGRKGLKDCEILRQEEADFTLLVNDKVVPTVDFIKDLMKGVVTSMLKNLKLEDKELRTSEIRIKYTKEEGKLDE